MICDFVCEIQYDDGVVDLIIWGNGLLMIFDILDGDSLTKRDAQAILDPGFTLVHYWGSQSVPL